MKYQQQVSVDLLNMVCTAAAYLALAGAAWLLLRLVQACFWLPRHMRRQHDFQAMFQEKVDSYERYVQDCEAKEDAECASSSSSNSPHDEKSEKELEKKRKERRECLEMLRKELLRIKSGGDPYNFDHLLDEEEKKLLSDLDEELDENKVQGDKDEKSDKQRDDLEENEKLLKEMKHTAHENDMKKDQ